MRKLFFLLFLPLCGITLAAPVRSMLGADGAEIVESDMPTALDYVQDGLVCMFDGIENVDWGMHDSEATTWTDLVGGRTTTWLSDASNSLTWENGGLRRIGTKGITTTVPWLSNITTNQPLTVEVVIEDDSATDTTSINSYYYFYGVGFRLGSMKGYPQFINYTGSVFLIYWDVPNYGFMRHTFAFVGKGTPYSNGGNRKNMDMYKDGIRTNTNAPLTVSTTNTISLFRATRDWPDTRDTTIYAVRIYSRALSDDEIAYNHFLDKVRFGL